MTNITSMIQTAYSNGRRSWLRGDVYLVPQQNWDIPALAQAWMKGYRDARAEKTYSTDRS